MPKKRNFLGGMQNYNPNNGEYESALVGPTGKPVEDADGDGKKHEGGQKFSKFDKEERNQEKGAKKSFDDINEKRMGVSRNKNNETYERKTDRKSNEDIDWDRVERNEKINGAKGKSQTRKDKYGNPLVSDEAFIAGYEAGKDYLEDSLKYNSLESLKKSNVFLGYLRDFVSNSIINNGYDPELDTTYQDENEIIGAITGEEVDMEEYESNATKGWTGKKYNGYKPQELNLDIEKEEPKVLSEKYFDEFYEKSNGDEDKMLDLIREDERYKNMETDPNDTFSMGDLQGMVEAYMDKKTGKSYIERFREKLSKR